MDKKTPNKRKSVANTTTTPTKFQKTGNTPDKKSKSPKAGKKSPQKKQFNGKQNTPKEKKQIKTEDEEAEDFLNDSEEIETEDSVGQVKEEMNGNSDNSDAEDDSDEEEDDEDDDDEDDDDDDDEEEETETKPKAKTEKNIPVTARKFSAFVGGLDFQTKESEIRALFDKDSILAVTVLKNNFTNKPKGCAFVNFKTEAALKKGLQKNGATLNGRILKISLPQKTNQTEKKKIILEKLKRKVQQLEQELAGNETKPTFNKKFIKKAKKAAK